MTKRNRIIVSIVGITIVLLALLGITYAYYLTRIEGNTNTNSISITTADLKLEYSDGNEIITTTNIMPGTTIGEKTFTVTNTGNTKIDNYIVVLEYASIDGVVPSVFKYPKDFHITLTCVSKNNTTNEVTGTCNGYTGFWNNETFEMNTNTIDSGIRHEYSLSIKYVDSGIDQSDDMGKNLNLKVQIYGSSETSTFEGRITGVDSTYAIKLNSNPKISTLKPTEVTGKYRYYFIGVEPGEHTLSLVNKDGEVVSTETITINKGTTSNINGSVVTVTENESTVHLLTSSSGTSLTTTATFNPYGETTLAYNIINNAKDNKNGTKLLNVPETMPAFEIAKYREESIYTGTSWDYGTYNDIYINSNAPSATSCTTDMIGSYLGQNGVKPTAIIIGCDKEKPVISDYIDEYESSLSLTKDDYGTSYYFRGDVKDNYITFADMCWRIVRIQGDGSVKLILEDRDNTCQTMNVLEYGDLNKGNWEIPTATGGTKYTGNFGFAAYNANALMASDGTTNTAIRYLEDYLKARTNKSISMSTAFKNFQSTFSDEEITKLKSGEFCFADKGYTRTGTSDLNYTYTLLSEIEKFDKQVKGESYYYDSYARLSGENKDGFQPTLKCNGTIMNDWGDDEINPTPMYVGAITMDEVVYAGAAARKNNDNYYLLNEYFKSGNAKVSKFWTLSMFVFARTSAYLDDYGYLVSNSGSFGYNHISSGSQGFRPAVILKSGTIISSGDGTVDNPYVVE